MVWDSHLFQNFPQFIVIHTVKGFGIVNKAEIAIFLELSRFFHDPADVGNLIAGSSAFSNPADEIATSITSTFYFVPLIYISVFVPVPYCLDDCGFVVEPEVRLIPLVPFFFLKIALAIQGFFVFPYKL